MIDPSVVIVGAGPAGLAAAAELVRRGVSDILVIDRDDAPGGLPRFCAHPGFGIGYLVVPRSGPVFARRLVDDLKKSGIRILCRTTMIGLEQAAGARIDVTITGPETGYRTLHPKAVLLATGTREASRGNLIIPGDRPSLGIMTTGQLQQMLARGVSMPEQMRDFVVIGSELVSFSAVWTLRRSGFRVSAMIEPGARIATRIPVGWVTRSLGVAIRSRTRLVAIRSRGEHVAGIDVERDGQTKTLACDGVILTANWLPEIAALPSASPLIDKAKANIATRRDGSTAIEGIFAAGNIRAPLKPSGSCARQGCHVGAIMAKYLSLADQSKLD